MINFCLALTTHLFVADDFNEVHPCARLEFEEWALGAYLNSRSRVSSYASYTFEQNGWFAEVGGVTGYMGADVLPFLRLGRDFEGARLFLAPAYTNNGEVGVVIGIEVPLN